ncbi:acid phosphatase 1-like [Quillaja saponaria]|uniref:Acid phosphatase 1-like n=1 Tax=Quillaja saponaria TaxID=32244 RepID=A0AAD7PPG4_QUISA|nr:acid phosphatase 1-like [Quillaja saponaria]
MLGQQYREDSVVANEAFLYAKSLNLSKDGNDIWIFDIDETTLSNLPYYAQHGFGVQPFNATTKEQRESTTSNLKKAGYHTWEKFILKDSSFSGKTAVFYKSYHRKKLEKKGYKIIANLGDQWSDLLETPTGNRTFKLPDPLYYIKLNDIFTIIYSQNQ